MVLLYMVGMPAFYDVPLLENSGVLVKNDNCWSRCSRVLSTSSLRQPYKPAVFYFEVIEGARRVLLAGVITFSNRNTASQGTVTLTLGLTFV